MNAPPTAIGLADHPRLVPHYRLQWEEVQKAWVLLYPEGMVKLNGSAGEIMHRLDGEKTVQAVIDELESQFDTTGLTADVLDFLAIAQRQGWVQS
ncbi:pyrroloquinoline quinone biosynthesis peptide chaperone PqqD [Polaromonas sp.]|jgi:pyrroloquinoline quinone biosynthesis protein D|uniref:pyrroloquinoline quinone biosynthesis peptide chaperone PqqD n=1 Tax=Polaromonas sp. TaxID=1869339 RepID=UPI002BAB4135|nr:pyrroloquinoline quinone biosynthesis peptide chaperone PqqD [Polaromonas sp.]HQS32275.1 pyrroloquinoline quinone biosynthesis peptide chaperone PqqD [Polaromonas sp.]HQS91393.1 pyrroloquinoline quinone biosynthesis peptide chaperone PqqD [Polaromonas sp.]